LCRASLRRRPRPGQRRGSLPRGRSRTLHPHYTAGRHPLQVARRGSVPVPRILENETTSPRDVANSLGITRLVLAVLVLYSHSFAIKGTASDPVADMLGGQEFPGGIAVKFFFALSGFLLFASLQR